YCLACEDESLSQDARVGAELGGPVAVAQDDDRRLADQAIVAGVEEPSERRLHLQNLEIAARHEESLGGQRLPLHRQVRAEQAVRGDAGEDGLRLPQVPEHRVAEDDVAVAGLVAALRAPLTPGRRQVAQTLVWWHTP